MSLTRGGMSEMIYPLYILSCLIFKPEPHQTPPLKTKVKEKQGETQRLNCSIFFQILTREQSHHLQSDKGYYLGHKRQLRI